MTFRSAVERLLTVSLPFFLKKLYDLVEKETRPRDTGDDGAT